MKLVLRVAMKYEPKPIEYKKALISMKGKVPPVEAWCQVGDYYVLLEEAQANKVAELLGGTFDSARREYIFPDPDHVGWEITCDLTSIKVNGRSHSVFNFSDFSWKIEPIAQGKVKKVASK